MVAETGRVAEKPIVVGIDGSGHSFEAADWAAQTARLRLSPLQLVMTNDDPARAAYADESLRQATERCQDDAPDVDISESVVSAHPVEELVRRSARAELIVLGSRGHGKVTDSLIGSVSAAVANRALCPVVVVRGAAHRRGPVAAVIDGATADSAVLEFAFDAAAHRDSGIILLRVWPNDRDLPPDAPQSTQAEIERDIREETAIWREKYPAVEVVSTVHSARLAALTHAAREARLLVVGRRDHVRVPGLMHGSVWEDILHHTPVPIVVVPVRGAETPPT